MSGSLGSTIIILPLPIGGMVCMVARRFGTNMFGKQWYHIWQFNRSLHATIYGEIENEFCVLFSLCTFSTHAHYRTIAPVFSGTIFSLSISRGARHVGFPVNYYLIFLIFGLTILLCTILGAGLPASINRQMGDSLSISGNESPSISIRTTDEDTGSSSSGTSGGNNGPETSV